MADPIVSSGDTAVADPSQSRSAFDALSASAPPQAVTPSAAPPSSPAITPGSDSASSDPFESMLKQAGDIMSGKVQPAADTPPPAPQPKPADKSNLPPPIKGPPKADDSQLSQDELDAMPFEKWPRSAQDWQKAKDLATRQANTLKRQIAELQEQVKSGTPEARSLLQERDQLRQELRAISIERDPEFKSKYDAAFSAVRSQLESMFGKDEADKAVELFNQPPTASRVKALEKFSEDMSPIKQSALAAALIEHDKHSRMRAQEISEASKNWDKLQMEGKLRSETAQKERADAFRSALKDTFNEWTDAKNGYGFLKRTGDAKADKHLDEMLELADVILTGENTPEEMSRAALYASMSPRLLTVLGERDARIAELEKELQSFRQSAPNVSHGDTTTADTSGQAYSSYGDAIAQAAVKEGLFRR